MSTILITGASGFIGKALAKSLSVDHHIVAMSRKDPRVDGITFIQGDFCNSVDLEALSPLNIDTVIHLAAVTGGCSEKEGILVNVEGTRTLMQALIGMGCKKFVLASSIALIGIQSKLFRPLSVPVPDTHPCLDRDGYGLSKHLMEEVSHYLARQHEEIDVINLRLSVVVTVEDMLTAARSGQPFGEWALGSVTMMQLEDGVRVFSMAAEAPFQRGVRTMNAAAPVITSTRPTHQVLEDWYGEIYDLSAYDVEGHQFDTVFDVSLIERELGFVALNTVRSLSALQNF